MPERRIFMRLCALAASTVLLQGCMTAMVLGRGQRSDDRQSAEVATLSFDRAFLMQSKAQGLVGTSSGQPALLLLPAPISLSSRADLLIWDVCRVQNESLKDPAIQDTILKHMNDWAVTEEAVRLDSEKPALVVMGVRFSISRVMTMALAQPEPTNQRALLLFLDGESSERPPDWSGSTDVGRSVLRLELRNETRPEAKEQSNAHLLALPGTILTDLAFLPISIFLYFALRPYNFF